MSSFINRSNSYLRSINTNDLELILTWRNSPEIRNLMFNNDKISWENHAKWFESVSESSEKRIKMFIENGKPRGIIQVNNICQINSTAEWGFYIGDAYRKGLGTLLALHALDYIFLELDIRKICAQVLSVNQVSLNFHKKVGFYQEGILREHIIRDEKKIDVYLFAQFNSDWKYNSDKLLGYK